MNESKTKPTPQIGETVKIHVTGQLEGVVAYVKDDGTFAVDPCHVVAEWVEEPYPGLEGYWSGLIDP